MSYNQRKQLQHIGTLKAKLLRKFLVVNIQMRKKLNANELVCISKVQKKNKQKTKSKVNRREENSKVEGMCEIQIIAEISVKVEVILMPANYSRKKIYTSLKAIHNGETLQLTPREKPLKEFCAQMHKDPVTYKK